MMKDMKWKNIDTVYGGKALQAEAEEINLHGEVNITGSLSVNGGSISSPTAADVSYDNTASGLTGTNVQDVVDELAGVRVKIRNFNNLAEFATWATTNYATAKILVAYDDSTHAWTCVANNTNLTLHSIYGGGGSLVMANIANNGTTTSGYYMIGNSAPSSAGSTYDNKKYQVYYV